MVRYLLERRDALTPRWKAHAATLINSTMVLFSRARSWNVTVMGEQDKDHKPWCTF